MDAAEAFNLTVKAFDLKPVELAKVSGIALSTISDFRHGNRDLRVSSMQKLASGFPPHARMYFYSLLSEQPKSEGKPIAA